MREGVVLYCRGVFLGEMWLGVDHGWGWLDQAGVEASIALELTVFSQARFKLATSQRKI